MNGECPTSNLELQLDICIKLGSKGLLCLQCKILDIKCKSSKSAILLKVLPGNKTALNHAMRLHFCKNKATKSNCSCTFLWCLLAVLSSTFRKPFDFFVNFVQLIIAMYAHSIQINIVCTTKLHQNYVKQWHTSLVIYGWTEEQMDGRKVKEGRKGGRSSMEENSDKTDLVFNLPFTFIITLQKLFLKKGRLNIKMPIFRVRLLQLQ